MVANKNPLYKASNQGIDRSGMVLPAEVVKKLQELLNDLFFVIVFFSSLSFYRGL